MKKEVIILVAEDDEGHASLIKKNLKRVDITNRIMAFKDGEELLNFLFRKGKGPHRKKGVSYILLMDIRMPKVDGIGVLQKIKQDKELRKIPVVIITTTDDPGEIEHCYALGCNNYITKPVDYEKFIETIKKLGFFMLVVEIPKINGDFVNERS